MAKVLEEFKAVLPGDVYPTLFEVGQDIEGAALDIALQLGKAKVAPAKKARKAAPENK